MSSNNKMLSIIRTGLLSVVASFVVVLVVALIVVPRATGSETYTILTSSMKPGLPPGTVIVVQPRAVEEIVVGDVITYQIESGKPEVVTHRVVGVSSDTRGEVAFTTRGDNNSVNDPNRVIKEQVKGVLIYSVPFVGLVLNQVTGSAKLWVPVAVGVLFLLIGAGYVASHVSTTRKAKGKVETRTSDGETHE